MITIEHLEVRFEVEGNGDDAEFQRRFEHQIRRWHEGVQDERRRRHNAESDRALSGRPVSEER